MNTFQLSQKFYSYEIDGVLQPNPSRQTDFIIDGIGLGQKFHFEASRPWFGRTYFEADHEAHEILISELCGKRLPKNQFGTNRLVLYLCHCGCDFCGVISCEILRYDNLVVWRDIRYETDIEDGDDEEEPICDIVITELRFRANDYDREIKRYLKEIS